MLKNEPKVSEGSQELARAQFSTSQAQMRSREKQSSDVAEGAEEKHTERNTKHTFRVLPAEMRLYKGEMPVFRGDHAVRDAMEGMLLVLTRFGDNSLRPRTTLGFKQSNREPVDITKLTQEVKRAKDFFDAASFERSDGLPPSIMIRNVAGEAAQLLEHFLIDLVTSYGHAGPSENDMPGMLHVVAEIKGNLRKLIQHFDTQMVSIAAQSGLFGQQPEFEPAEENTHELGAEAQGEDGMIQ